MSTGNIHAKSNCSSAFEIALGSAWFDLPPSIQCLHKTFAPKQIQGQFKVSHGQNWVSKWIARLLRLPKPSSAVDVTLVIERQDFKEIWTRRFGNAVLKTTLWCNRGYLIERFGCMEFCFQAENSAQTVIYKQSHCALSIGCCSLKLPKWIAPVVCGTECASPVANCVEVMTSISLPAAGLLLSYRGLAFGSNSPLL